MSTQTRGITLFPLQIKMDQDGMEFTHIYGGIGHVLTPKELPSVLWMRLHPLVSCLFEGEIQILRLTPNQIPFYQLVPQKNDLLKDLSEETEETLALTAWWMEWCHRKKTASHRDWKCIECEKHVPRTEGRCPDIHCSSRKILQEITGESGLKLITAPPVAQATGAKPTIKKTGTNHQ
ncbi:hypothetical protein HYV70_00455 [Candidatus Uhrbacteria bacterium]|nr:hypothetical protein [Candidatus Uhrbacteria bacterium]